MKKDVKKKYHHSGVWEQRRGDLFKKALDKNGEPIVDVDSEEENLEQDTVYNWSCCGNSVKDSKGCVVVQKEKNKWILSSY
jgi:hypothetical protein